VTVRYGFLGPAGTFTEAALLTVATSDDDLLPYPSVATVLEAVRDGSLDAAMVPLENSVEGSVATTLDELAGGAPLQVVREVLLPVSFVLLVRTGTATDAVQVVATHPHAEAQCRRWLRTRLPQAEVVLTTSTAEAARAVSVGTYDAAVAAPVAAARYGLQVLAEDLQDHEGAVTRFVLVTRPGAPSSPTGADRTTLFAFIREDHPGALLQVLTEFAVRGINLSRIESRPTGDRLGRYFFSVDCDGHLADARVGEALSALRRVCADVRVLGSYARADGTSTVAGPGTSDTDFADAAAWLTRVRSGQG
jgi:prephenate dehydratase